MSPEKKSGSNLRQWEKNILNMSQEWQAAFNSVLDMVSIHDKDFKILET